MSAVDESWARIEAEALAQKRATFDELEKTPLVYGERIAWAKTLFGKTDDLSSVHRVGFPIENMPHTSCGEKIPHFALWLVLSPNFIRALDCCRFCEAEYSRAIHGEAAA